MNHKWNFDAVWDNPEALIAGAVGTLRIFVICLVLGLSLGLLVGLGRYARRQWIYIPVSIFVEFFRNTPVLVQILWFYFALPILMPFEISPLMAAALGITLNSAAFSGEIFRGGIQSLESSQWEGAQALGMTHAQALRRIILPQAVKRMLPALTNRGVQPIGELLQQGKLIASINYNPIEAYTVVALIFFAFLYPLVQATYLLERKLRQGD